MKTYKEISKFRKEIKSLKSSEKSIGFVPTMGNLHEGHLSLLRKSSKDNDISVLSIYINPTQFGPKEDFENYPQTLDKDLGLAKETGCKLIFLPDNNIMYPDGFSTYVDEEKISKPLCGAKRPGHFRGVTTVVAKLFNIVDPDISYFGQKDAQQALVIKKVAADLNFRTKIKVLPTVREKNGLAMSSRNNYLEAQDREKASIIYKSLMSAQKAFQEGEKQGSKIAQIIREALSTEPEIKIDYLDLRSNNNLEAVKEINLETLIAIGVTFKGVHLIDNIVLKP